MATPIVIDMDSAEGSGADLLVNRISTVARFDTVVFNSETNVFEVWRYSTGTYQGVHEVVILMSCCDWIRDIADLREVAILIGRVASLPYCSEENDLPEPWWGFRFR